MLVATHNLIRLLRSACIGLVFLAASSCCYGVERPNFIIIFIDDMGYGDVGFNGATGPSTPHLDQMAAEGMRFNDFYVGCAVCSGSRTALLTGTHYRRLSMDAVLFPNSKQGLHPDEVTIADMLKTVGYQTACVGKWHLGHLPPCLPTYQGFDSYYGIPYSNDMWIDPANKLAEDIVVRNGLSLAEVKAGHKKRNWVPLFRDEEVIEYPTDQTTITKRYTEEAIRFIRANKEQPFFLYLPHTMVHLPLAVSEAFDGRTDKLIWDAIEEVDWSVGQILQTLREEAIDERTLVVFTSDNGAAVGSSLPLRSQKGSVYDGGIREPTLMHWPGQIPAGETCHEVAASIDLLPTFAKLAGAALPERPIDGKDIWPLMSTKGAKSPHKHYVLMHGAGTVRAGKWKFYPWSEAKGKDRGARLPGRTPTTHPVQLYDTVADISERNNVAQQHPEIVSELQQAYDDHLESIKRTRRPTATLQRPAGAVSPAWPNQPNTITLFNGLRLNAWTLQDPQGWVVENDMVLSCRMKEVQRNGKTRTTGRGYIWTKKQFENFELTLQYKLSEAANSGIFFRTDPANPVQGGFEIQLLDDSGYIKSHPEAKPNQLNGSLYDCQAPTADASRPLGQWNDLQLTCEKSRIRVVLNDSEVLNVDIDNWDTPRENPDGSPNKFKSALKTLPRIGHIGLQNHGQKVWFRDIVVRELD